MPAAALSLRARALRCLAQREHSRDELRRKLARHVESAADREAGNSPDDAPGDTAAVVEALLDALETEGWLSAQRFVESRVHARAARFGNLRIRHELGRHGLQLDATTAQTLTCSEFERAQAVWARKFSRAAEDPAGRARQARFLARRGFSPDVIRRVLKGGAGE